MISVSDCVKCLQVSDGDDVTDTPGQVGGAEDEAQQEAESEGPTEPTEPEASSEEHENKESAETLEGDLSADMVGDGNKILVFIKDVKFTVDAHTQAFFTHLYHDLTCSWSWIQFNMFVLQETRRTSTTLSSGVGRGN